LFHCTKLGIDKFPNYRPISLLPQFSKILEKLFSNRLDKFLDKHEILSDNQYGFRPNSSTSLALIDSIEEITNALEHKQYTVKKAFDTINHNILIHKLERYGIRGVVLHWVKTYLRDRKQFVKLLIVVLGHYLWRPPGVSFGSKFVFVTNK